VENHIVRAQHRSHKRENLGVVFNRCIRYSFHQSPDGGSSGLGQPDVAGSISLDRLTAQRPMGKKRASQRTRKRRTQRKSCLAQRLIMGSLMTLEADYFKQK